MKKVKYIYKFFIVLLFGLFSFACSDDDIEQGDENELSEYSGEPIQTSFKVCVSAPDVSVDVDGVTRAGDNANIDYAMPENGGRFQNIVILVTDNSNKVYGLHCNKWYDTKDDPTSFGMKDYEYIFPDMKINDTKAKVYVFGNVSADVYETICGYKPNENPTYLSRAHMNEINLLVNTHNISVEEKNLYNIRFKPKEGNFKVGDTEVTTYCTGMPVNAMATSDVKKGSTVFNVHMKRVCARLQVTFRNFTGKTDYDDTYYGIGSKGNRVYVDNFVLKKALATSTKYFYNGTAPSSATVDFDILAALGGTNNHECNMIENGESKTVSLYVFESVGNQSKTVTVDKKTQVTTKYYTYDLKVDRGKSLGQQVQELQDDNVYVMWSDNLDPKGNGLFAGDYHNTFNRCLGADDNNIVYNDLRMDSPDKIPYGTYTDANKYGNRVFWHYNDGRFQSCKVNLNTDECELTKKYIGEKTASIFNQPAYETKLQNSGHSFTISPQYFDGFNRIALKVAGSSYMMISNDILKARYISGITTPTKSTNPWVFFAKYIIKNGEAFSTGTGTSKTDIQQIERNGSYELDFSVMPNYDTKQELLVNCVRKQSEISWSETQK